jgi:hypothetical protein
LSDLGPVEIAELAQKAPQQTLPLADNSGGPTQATQPPTVIAQNPLNLPQSYPERRQLPDASQPVSDTHSLEKLHKNVTQLHSTRFSVAPEKEMAKDVALVKRYVEHHNKDAPLPPDVAHITHTEIPNSQRIEYDLGHRKYSSHEDSGQLYPLSGTGVHTGTGARDLARLLHARKELTDDRRALLAQVHHGIAAPAKFKEMKKPEQKEHLANFKAMVKKKKK